MERIDNYQYCKLLKKAMDGSPIARLNCSYPNFKKGDRYYKSTNGISYLRADGFMGGLCRTSKGGHPVAQAHQRKRIKDGGYFLECYDGKLVELYEKQGFKVVVRIPFMEEIAEIGWEQHLSHRPDLVFMSLYDLPLKNATNYNLAYDYAKSKVMFMVFWTRPQMDKLIMEYHSLELALYNCGKTERDAKLVNVQDDKVYAVEDKNNLYIKEIPLKFNI